MGEMFALTRRRVVRT